MRISDWSSDVCSSDLLDFLVIGRAEDEALHIDARQVDAIGVEAADGHDLLDLGDADLRGGRHRLVEIACGLAENQITALVGLPSLDDRQVGKDAALQDIILSIEILDFLAFGDRGADPGRGIESGNARAPGAAALGERALRTEFDLQFAGQILPLELLVLADIGGDHLPDLPGAEQLAQPLAVDAGVVARDGEVLDPRIADRVDQPRSRRPRPPIPDRAPLRSEERRVGKEWVRRGNTRW